MRGRFTMVVVGVVMGCGGAAPHPKAGDTMSVRRYQLHNGMTVVLVPEPSATMVTALVRYGVGAVDDPIHQEGVAHLAAHVMNDQRLGGTTLATQLERVAIRLDVEPRPMWTSFYSRFAPENLDAVVKLEAVRLASRCEHLDEATFAAERANVAEELATHDSWRINRNVGEAIYPPDDPMRRAYAADATSVRALSKAQTCDFIDRHYAAGNATMVVSGPIAPDAFERAVSPLGGVAARSFDPPAKTPARAGGPMQVEAAADVSEPTLAVAWPSPEDLTKRVRFDVLLRQVALKTHAGLFGDERYLVLWIPIGTSTVEAKLEEMKAALAGSVDALTERNVSRRTGRRPIRRQTDAFDDRTSRESFDRVRRKYLLEDLIELDNALARVSAIARKAELETMIEAHSHLDGELLSKTLETDLDPSLAKIIVLKPDGSRPATRTSNLIEPNHELRRPLEIDTASADATPRVPPSVLAHAKELRLANGLTVVLAPSSAIPLAHVRLVFGAGTAASPLRRVANAAAAALLSVVTTEPKGRGARLRWHTDWDSTQLSFTGASSQLQAELEWFVGLRAAGTDKFADAAKRALADAQHTTTAAEAGTHRADVFRAHLFGAHPYGAPLADDSPSNVPTLDDVKAFADSFLQPEGATLIVTGGFDPVITEQTIRRVFEPWQGHARPLAIEKVGHSTGSVVVLPEALPWIELRLGWAMEPADNDFSARVILAEMLDRLSPRAHAAYVLHRFGGDLELRGAFERDNAATEIAALRDAIAALGDGSVASRALFAVARRDIAVKNAAGPGSSAEWSESLARLPELGHDLAWRQKLAERTVAVQYEDVRRIIANELTPTTAVWLLSGPEDAIAAVNAKLGAPSK